MKIFKRISAAAVALLMLLSFAACNGENGEKTTEPTESTTSYIRENKTRIATLSGPLGIGIAKLAKDRDYAYTSTLYSDAQQVVTLLKDGKTDLAVLPVNLAATVCNEADVKIIAVNTLGVLHILENGREIKTVDDLRGKTVYAIGEGSLPEFLLDAVLEANGLDGRVNVEFKEDYSEIASLAGEGKAKIVMLPEPYASTLASSTEGMRFALDLSDEWQKAKGTPFAQSVIVARSEYIENNAEYIETFLMQNEISVNYLIENSVAGAEMLAETGNFENGDVAAAALAGCNPKFMRGEEMKTALKAEFEMLYQANAASIGGKIPEDSVYFAG